MAYRRRTNFEEQRAWAAWIDEHRNRLAAIGLPLAVYQDAEHWYDFLENGHLHWHSDGPPFDFTELGPGQMHQLLAFLERYHSGSQPPLVSWLRARLAERD